MFCYFFEQEERIIWSLILRLISSVHLNEGSYRQLAKRFIVSLGFVQNLLKRYRETGQVDSLPHGGGSVPSLTAEQMETAAELLRTYQDATWLELCARLDEMTLRLSQATMSR